MKLALAGLALASLAVAGDVSAKCDLVRLGPTPLVGDGAVIADDGGLVVGYGRVDDDASAAKYDEDAATAHGWTAKLGAAKVDLVRTQLAPGLAVYKPSKPAAGKLAVAGAKGKAIVTVAVEPAAKHPVLAAPAITKVVTDTRAGFRGANESRSVAYVDAVPDGAVALVAYAGSDALTFGRPAHDKQGATSVVIYEGPGHCGFLPNGMRAPEAGTKVKLAWVDASGRVSPLGKELTVDQ